MSTSVTEDKGRNLAHLNEEDQVLLREVLRKCRGTARLTTIRRSLEDLKTCDSSYLRTLIERNLGRMTALQEEEASLLEELRRLKPTGADYFRTRWAAARLEDKLTQQSERLIQLRDESWDAYEIVLDRKDLVFVAENGEYKMYKIVKIE